MPAFLSSTRVCRQNKTNEFGVFLGNEGSRKRLRLLFGYAKNPGAGASLVKYWSICE